MPEEVITNARRATDPNEIPEIEQDTLNDAVEMITRQMCTTLQNLLHLDYQLDITVEPMGPYPGYEDQGVKGLVPLDKDGLVDPEDVLIPHVFVHLCHNSRVHKMYSEFTYDRNMLWYLRDETGIYSNFREKVCKSIYKNYTDIMGYHERIFMMRPHLYCPKEYTATDVLTINTVGHWQNLEGKYEFLNDKIEAELAFAQYKIPEDPESKWQTEQQYFQKIEDFASRVHEINELFVDGTYTHDQAFEQYREFFNEEFKDPYEELNEETGEMETKYYEPLYDFYEKFYIVYFNNLVPDEPDDNSAS